MRTSTEIDRVIKGFYCTCIMSMWKNGIKRKYKFFLRDWLLISPLIKSICNVISNIAVNKIDM